MPFDLEENPDLVFALVSIVIIVFVLVANSFLSFALVLVLAFR